MGTEAGWEQRWENTTFVYVPGMHSKISNIVSNSRRNTLLVHTTHLYTFHIMYSSSHDCLNMCTLQNQCTVSTR